jgi:hypothetical protein
VPAGIAARSVHLLRAADQWRQSRLLSGDCVAVLPADRVRRWQPGGDRLRLVADDPLLA